MDLESVAAHAPAKSSTFRLLPHQRKLAADVLADLRAGKDEVLLAACPGFGKTEVAIWLIRELLRAGRVKRVLVLPHGTKVLLDNFKDRLNLRAPGLLSSGKVVLALPHEWNSVVGKFDLVVSDESHDFYEVEDGMVAKAIRRVGAGQTLLLTGTPSKFIRRGVKPHAFALHELMECGHASDVQVILAQAAYRVRKTAWNSDGELRKEVKLPRKATEKTIDDVLEDLCRSVELATSKTIIACRDEPMAKHVGAVLSRRRIEHLVSECKDDGRSANVRTFRLGRCPVLVVVKRATLGFDMPMLANFIDMTGSRNPDRIFQMVCRLVRRPTTGEIAKRFVKVMPPVFAGVDLEHFMTGVMMLGDREVYTSWQGGAINKLVVGVRESAVESDTDGSGHPERKPLLPRAMMTFGNLFKAMSAGFASTTLGDVLGFQVRDAARTKERIRAWVEKHRRRPSRVSRNNEESRLAVSLKMHETTDPLFASEIEELVPKRVTDSAKRKAEILTFLKKFRRRPRQRATDAAERRLFSLLMAYTSARSETFDASFRARALKLVPLKTRPEQKKREILAWIKAHGRRPSNHTTSGNERKLAWLYGSYTGPSSSCFDPQFKKACLRIAPPKHNSAANKAAILRFVQRHGRWPRAGSRPEEYRLRCLLNNYVKAGWKVPRPGGAR